MNMPSLKVVLVVIALVLLGTAAAAYSSGMTGSSRSLGAGGDTVALCQVRSYTVTTSGPISTVTPTVRCSAAGSYVISVTVTSGPAYGVGSTTRTLTANSNTAVAVTISPSVTITGSGYNVVINVLHV